MNHCIFTGNLTHDPELRHIPSGVAVTKFRIAVTTRLGKDDDGNAKEETAFLDVQAWRGQAETIAQYLSKGDPILVVGRVKIDEWDDKTTGEKRLKPVIVLDRFEFMRSGNRRNEATPKEDDAQPEEAPDAGESTPEAPEAKEAPTQTTKRGRGRPRATVAAGSQMEDKDIPFD